MVVTQDDGRQHRAFLRFQCARLPGARDLGRPALRDARVYHAAALGLQAAMESHLRDERPPEHRHTNHRKLRRRAAVLGLLAAAVAGSTLAPALADGKGKRTLQLVANQTQYEFLDIGPDGNSLGDRLTFGEVFTKQGDQTGRSGVVCTVTNHEPAPSEDMTVNCVGSLRLQHGQINLQGLMDLHGAADPGPFKVAIVGGTGRYRGASGEAVAEQPNPPENRYVYTLRLQ